MLVARSSSAAWGRAPTSGHPLDIVVGGLGLTQYGFGVLDVGERLDKLCVVGAVEQFLQVGLCGVESGAGGGDVFRARAFAQLGKVGAGDVGLGFDGGNFFDARAGAQLVDAGLGAAHARFGLCDGDHLALTVEPGDQLARLDEVAFCDEHFVDRAGRFKAEIGDSAWARRWRRR